MTREQAQETLQAIVGDYVADLARKHPTAAKGIKAMGEQAIQALHHPVEQQRVNPGRPKPGRPEVVKD